ncbi:MAG TPA: M1 family metallopeptidase [Oleiagrimonas sp.]|nr:M1 family metallopeptidase [Oleiagrimonas sp.]
MKQAHAIFRHGTLARLRGGAALALIAGAIGLMFAPAPADAAQHQKPKTDKATQVSRARMLQGAYGPYRANNDLLYYHLTLRVDPVAKTIRGDNLIRFRMLKDGRRIQIDLQHPLQVDKIVFEGKPLAYRRDAGAVFIDFPHMLTRGKVYTIDFHYSGEPRHHGRFGDFTFGADPNGKPWIFTACETDGSSTWWPSKDQWRDEPQGGMDISVSVPDGLMDVSNGKFMGKVDQGDGYTQWNWKVHYPINSYDVALNIAHYTHFSDADGNYYVLPQDLAKAKKQFAQVKEMMKAYDHYFGPYPFAKDGYKLVQVPYAGMEHQSAVAYGNGFENGYYGKDWTGVGISKRFDFIIIHETGHEWFGNAVTAADRADMWIQEGFTTYMEGLYVEYRWGKQAAITYLNGLKPKVRNERPIIAEHGVAAVPPEDQYFKGALMLNTLRNVIDDDARWWALLRGFYQHFKYQTIDTDQVVAYFNKHSGKNLTPIFNQYLRHAKIPTLQLLFGESPGQVMYKWKAAEPDFAMPIRVGQPGHWQIIHPTTHWQWMHTSLDKNQFQVAKKLYYINVNKQ